ncbi:MAG TPA: hypothetical protein VGM81_09680 [Burkholderiaceae bacterium]|jgi:hypothetical protein
MNSKFAPLLISVALGLLSGAVMAQTTAAKAPAKAAPKHVTKSPAKKQAAKPAPVPAALPDALPEQIEAAKLAYLGQYECELKQSIMIEPHTAKEGYVDVHWEKQTFTMKPVLSSTGALRLEDVTGRTLMIQIANKSMLLDVKAGQRLVDDCISPRQRELMASIAAQRAADAASGVVEADSSLGLGTGKN